MIGVLCFTLVGSYIAVVPQSYHGRLFYPDDSLSRHQVIVKPVVAPKQRVSIHPPDKSYSFSLLRRYGWFHLWLYKSRRRL